ncbi:MAG: hypothetical protein KAI64_04885 [Thermoplasmata archaeon]|nr:hypothetical protein [Thermoplasmata archaeon]
MAIEKLAVIGNSWGKPAGVEGAEHYWRHGTGEDREVWRSICEDETLEKMDEFGGTPIINLTIERNPIKQNRCERCVATRSLIGGK